MFGLSPIFVIFTSAEALSILFILLIYELQIGPFFVSDEVNKKLEASPLGLIFFSVFSSRVSKSTWDIIYPFFICVFDQLLEASPV